MELNKNATQTSIVVQNLKCAGCAKTITNKISEIEHITNVTIDIENSIVSFTSDSVESALKVKGKLKTIGYPSVDDNNTFSAKAKSFVSCATGKISS